MGNSQETLAIGQRGFLIRGLDNEVWFRVYQQDKENEEFVDYEITNHDCEVVIIDKDAAFIRTEAGDFLDYTTESMRVV
jgi:vacuolar-type H+-ATPase subunit F/Vma7